jgi:MATE family multidrug resistance protein
MGVLLSVMAVTVAGVYTRDSAVIALAATGIVYFAAILVFDGGQRVLGSALRGCGDTWVVTVLYAVSYIGVMVPVRRLLAFPLGHGVAGLLEAVLVASIVSAAGLGWRFHVLVRSR